MATLLQQARSSPEVRVLRASISPSNEASLALIKGFPFEHAGEEDGLEYVFEARV